MRFIWGQKLRRGSQQVLCQTTVTVTEDQDRDIVLIESFNFS